jgi:hypothetical protein
MHFSISTILTSLLVAYSGYAAVKGDGHKIPQCEKIAAACEAAGFQPGDHKKNGKGLWVDCIGKIAKGETVAGVSSTKDEALACEAAKKEKKAERHAQK